MHEWVDKLINGSINDWLNELMNQLKMNELINLK